MNTKKNAKRLLAFTQSILYCAHQEIGLRGNKECNESLNQGNLIQLLKMQASSNEIIERKLRSHITYTSSDIQNKVLECYAELVITKISQEARESGFFALIIDSSKDIIKRDHLSIVIRYVLNGSIFERLIGAIRTTSFDAESTKNYVVEYLKNWNFDIKSIVAQTYDGASVMKGEHGGLQAKIKEITTYVHCWAHQLNLVLVDIVADIPKVDEFFSKLQSLYVYFTKSIVRHEKFLSVQKEMCKIKESKVVELKDLSDTRWYRRNDSIKAVVKSYDCLVEALKDLSSQDSIAIGYTHQLKDKEFLT